MRQNRYDIDKDIFLKGGFCWRRFAGDAIFIFYKCLAIIT